MTIRSNYGLMLYNFRDKARYCRKSQFFTPYLHLIPYLRGTRWIIATTFGVEKLERRGY